MEISYLYYLLLTKQIYILVNSLVLYTMDEAFFVQIYLGKPIGLSSIFKPLLFQKKVFKKNFWIVRPVVTPMDRN